MPGVSKDMNGYRDFEQGHLRTSSYANGYDPYRRERDGMSNYPPPGRSYAGDFPTSRSGYYARSARSEILPSARSYGDHGYRRHNGVDDIEQNSFEMGMRDGNEPTFEVDHLATYTSKSGTTHPEDGLTKLKQMESSTGIWTMRCMLIVERRNIIVIDKGNGDELERFPLSHVHEPTAVLKNDRRETYNNLVLFTILDDPRRKNGPSDMHIFQSVNAPAHDIVDEILSAKGEGGGKRGQYDKHIPPPPSGPAPEPPYGRGYGQSRVGDFRASYIHREDMDTGQNEALERDVQLLNNCFDDIEKFVSRLQQAAEAYKELERRRVERGGKRKQKSAGDGMLMMRARPPPADDFIDIFQKFKFAFNLLAKLKAHIHDPNAPELVHFLFTPLSLIYEASRDPIHGGRDLSSEAVAPLLLHDAKQLLLNCLTSKELELWQRLGRPWTLVKDEWNSSVPPYNPRFYNGWQPSPQLVDEVNQQDRLRDVQERSVPYVDPLMASRREDPYTRDIRQSERREDPYRMTDRREDPYRMTERRDDPYRSTERREDPYRMTERREDPYSREIRSDRDFGRSERRDDYNRPPSPSPPRNFDQDQSDFYSTFWTKRASAREPVSAPKTRAEENVLFAQDLKRMGATIYEAVHERTGKNAKELTVEKGDILQVLDKSRNWWKLKNYQGETGYAPYTILKEYQPRDDFDNGGGGQRLSGDYNSYINGGAPPAPPPPAANRPASRGEAERRQREPPAELRQNRPIPASRPHGEKSMYSEDLHNELRNKMNTSDERMSPRGREDRLSYTQDDRSYQQSSPHRHSGSYTQDDRSYPQPPPSRQNSSSPRSPVLNNRRNYNINQYSTPEEVREWIEIKGFSRRCMDLLTGYNGLDLFGLDKHELERLLGRDEGRFLDSLLMVQKNNAGFRTRGASELRAILERRKERSDTDGRRDDGFGARPSFMPETPPDYSPAESDASSDDYGDAGKTLRNLLERQRKKLQQVGYNGPYQ
ncbi:epidermal growth factor receptor kinase substrate 8-like isoform X7 [Mercenaria mercenaria]|uniref:epidermal growth factor receptor kinase substrate 8-like isoform X7 n=1 Tax=Mercenaria mercenaria TaxID=6596 RepID=UPI00234EAB96|nr:epidermal growth factor receptor kinase substrate 8-like isoform X7 [Mercenaria mercenaria]